MTCNAWLPDGYRPDFFVILCVLPFVLLDYGSATPPRPPAWHNPRKRRDQILPSGNLAAMSEWADERDGNSRRDRDSFLASSFSHCPNALWDPPGVQYERGGYVGFISICTSSIRHRYDPIELIQLVNIKIRVWNGCPNLWSNKIAQ